MNDHLRRRDFLKLVGAGAVAAAVAPQTASAAPPKTAGTIPTGKIGNLELSRLMLGTNHITFYMHSRDLRYVRELSQHYNTDEKIIETFASAEAHGINTFITHSEAKIEKLFKEYRNRHASKMKWILAPWLSDDGRATDSAGYGRLVPKLVENGADALYVPGMLAEPLLKEGKGAVVADLLEVIKAAGVPTGISAHSLDVVRFCEKEKLPVDFYVKTFHHLKYPTAPKPETIATDYAEVPGFWCRNPDETADFMKSVTKPWIAFKVMAAGAIPPRDAFRYAFAHGADFILAGVFDFQIAEDAQITRDTLASIKSRPRPWRG
ncbi:MAG: twin-arginine translocation signal domain-containing protein [Verrucomicrobia bacterium]|nr:twin-arginine translocation signal domain-containing protein [Verrucomicrobiota bacterium]